ncbi:alpha/beta hydrolase [Ectothiorhodospiraceae bacterium WFHF3C12]|nr:alpha/beta hydrolase [Ectothiorhodospiraceae bacterium WFHF3C12]
MFLFLILLLLSALVLLGLYRWLRNRVGPAPPPEPFEGHVYRVGAAAIAVRDVSRPRVSVIAMHGFMEDFRYFVDFYDQPGVQFIGVLSGDYHLPVSNPDVREASWAKPPAAPLGTIRHDAEVLCQALEHLPPSPRVRVHGHSRGGAVVVEAAGLRPDLFQDVEVVLEAPVLPGGTPYRELPAPVRWLLPLLMPLWRRWPINPTNLGAWGRLDIPRKRELIESLPYTPRRVSTMLTNLRDMEAWMHERGVEALAPLKAGVVLVPDRDRVLSPTTMAASARCASALETVTVAGCSHFVRFDQPGRIPSLPQSDGRAVAQ